MEQPEKSLRVMEKGVEEKKEEEKKGNLKGLNRKAVAVVLNENKRKKKKIKPA